MSCFYKEGLTLKKARPGDVIRNSAGVDYVRVERCELPSGLSPNGRVWVREVVWDVNTQDWRCPSYSRERPWDASNTMYACSPDDLRKFARRKDPF